MVQTEKRFVNIARWWHFITIAKLRYARQTLFNVKASHAKCMRNTWTTSWGKTNWLTLKSLKYMNLNIKNTSCVTWTRTASWTTWGSTMEGHHSLVWVCVTELKFVRKYFNIVAFQECCIQSNGHYVMYDDFKDIPTQLTNVFIKIYSPYLYPSVNWVRFANNLLCKLTSLHFRPHEEFTVTLIF